MTKRIQRLRDYIVNHEHHSLRQSKEVYDNIDISDYKDESKSLCMRVALRFKKALDNEVPVFLPDEKIAFTRTLPDLPPVIEWEDMPKGRAIVEKGRVMNIAPDYGKIIAKGLLAVKKEVEEKLALGKEVSKDFYASELIILNTIENFVKRYRLEAERLGYIDIAEDLKVVPANPPKTFKQALQMLRVLHYCIWVEGEYHVTLCRFDQIFYPYLKKDLDAGVISKEEALEILEDFFISCNKDTDFYNGLQQGDNGQSMVLGGLDKDGNDTYNLLSELCLQASLELKVIDPKINLRVNKNTPRERLLFASKLTAQGLGFPQYSNDEIVIEGLKKLGYDEDDAYNYCVAACWEFIIPAVGMEVVNIGALCYNTVANDIIKEYGKKVDSLEELVDLTAKRIKEVAFIDDIYKDELFIVPAPFMSIFFDGCLENGKDISLGNKYNNYGQHGVGIGNAVDSLSSFAHFVYDTKEVTADEYFNAIENDYVGYEELRNKIVNFKEKFGNGIAKIDQIAKKLMKAHSDAGLEYRNPRGGICRAGTGSANVYASPEATVVVGADGRKKGQFFPANYTPSIIIKTDGPFSVIKSLSTPSLVDSINGGPATFEFSANSIASEQGVEKIALLVENFIKFGGHQLQLNVINKSALIDAQKHPENYRNLIVRVWGWSGYFVELDKRYQEQIILRADYSL